MNHTYHDTMSHKHKKGTRRKTKKDAFPLPGKPEQNSAKIHTKTNKTNPQTNQEKPGKAREKEGNSNQDPE